MLPDNLRGDIAVLLGRLRVDGSLYDQSLAERLKAILDYDGPDVRGHVRANISMADWNYFQSEVNSATTMHQAYASSPEPYAPGLTNYFAERLAIARENHRVIDALMRFGWTFPLTQP